MITDLVAMKELFEKDREAAEAAYEAMIEEMRLQYEQVRLDQCDQIGQFIALWATFQSLWQQLFCSNSLHFWAILKGSKSFVLLLNDFWTIFIDIWQLFTGHAAYRPNSPSIQVNHFVTS